MKTIQQLAESAGWWWEGIILSGDLDAMEKLAELVRAETLEEAAQAAIEYFGPVDSWGDGENVAYRIRGLTSKKP